jgi:hypothetical protein
MRAYIPRMDPTALSNEETQTIIDYARQKFAEERWPMSPSLRPIRESLEKLYPKPEPEPLPAPKPYMPSLLAQRKKARRR